MAAGITGAYEGDSLVLKISLATFLGIAWYNSLELCVLVFVTFNRYRGLYFWSLLTTAVAGVVPYCIGFLIKFFGLMSQVWLSLALLTVGWWIMITGQSFVLYSRLHLVLRDPAILRWVLIMIIVNVFLLHVPTTVFTFGSNSDVQHLFVDGYNIMEKVQMTGFCVQEFVISTLYIWETIKLLRVSPEKKSRRIMYQLLSINFIFIIMDLGLLGCVYADLYIIETTLKATIYSIKLKLEFAVLTKLMHLVHSHVWNPHFDTDPNGIPDFVDASQLATDVTRAPQCANRPPTPPWSGNPSTDMRGANGEKRDDGQQATELANGDAVDGSRSRTPTSSTEGERRVDLTTVIPPP